MRVNIKLDERAKGRTSEGFPIVLVVTHDYKQKIIRLGYYSEKNQWNRSLSAPKTSHPKFYEVNDYLLKIKQRVSHLLSHRIENKLTISQFKDKLFEQKSPVFFEAAVSLLPDGYTGTKLSALNSFDGIYPSAKMAEITKDMVSKYIDALRAKGNEPGGIDSYIRSLKALWNRLSDSNNPFKGHKIQIPSKVKRVSTRKDIRKLKKAKLSDKGSIASYSKCRDYWLLMFYLGGIDPEVLAKLRYDRNIQNGRLVFNREKGGSKMPCNNTIPKPALQILEKYDCHPYLVPIYRTGNYDSFIRNFRRALIKIAEELELGVVMHPKSARYTFIDRAQQLLIDERITAQIVGHKRKTVTSLYTNEFPLDKQDKAHLKIVDLSKKKSKKRKL
jgi:integrase